MASAPQGLGLRQAPMRESEREAEVIFGVPPASKSLAVNVPHANTYVPFCSNI